MKTTLDNDLINHVGAIYTENDIEQLWLIRPSEVYDENQTGQQPIIQVRSMLSQY